MSKPPVVVWFRKDLRLADNPALDFALSTGSPIIPVFVWNPSDDGEWAVGGASKWWLHRSLGAFSASLEKHASRLIIRSGPALPGLRRIVQETGARTVVWNRRYEPASIAGDTAVKQGLLDDGIDARSFNGALLFSPMRIRNQSGQPFKVFTPFWKHCLTHPVREVVPFHMSTLPNPLEWPESEDIEGLRLNPRIEWDVGFRDIWQPGEAGAQAALRDFLGAPVERYASDRDRPDISGTSRLSPHLHWGEISPAQVYHAVEKDSNGRGASVFLSQIGWREFAHHLLFHFPHTTTEPLRPEFERFPWSEDREKLRAWQRGQTGYPIADAGMRQLWQTGWMHNRVRMVVASFLVKHLLLPWQEGARWFWDTLVDADLANNTLGWQWSAGCGADAAPYFRIFNPILQGTKFDPEGDYVKKWVPELGRLPAKHIHAPWEAPTGVLEAAGVKLGENYPRPLVDHGEARTRALEAYEVLKSGA
jgi:deoxyribodipyrimidine photo-lyase